MQQYSLDTMSASHSDYQRLYLLALVNYRCRFI